MSSLSLCSKEYKSIQHKNGIQLRIKRKPTITSENLQTLYLLYLLKIYSDLYCKGKYCTHPYKNSNVHSEQIISAVCLNGYKQDRGSLGVFLNTRLFCLIFSKGNGGFLKMTSHKNSHF